MSISKVIWRGTGKNSRKYYLYDTYSEYEDALSVAKNYRKKNKKNKYWVQKVEVGYMFPEPKFALYMTHIIPLFGTR